jgi:hypothetical protein
MSDFDASSVLSEEILLKTFSYMDKQEVIATAGTCRSWRNIVRDPRCATCLKSIAKTHYPFLLEELEELEEATGRLNAVHCWYDLLVRTDKLCLLADQTRRRHMNAEVESIRGQRDQLFGLWGGDGWRHYESPTSGTTATAIPDENGRFAEPVYYDWGANWDRVSSFVETREVQDVLMRCINEVANGYHFTEWNEETIWPFLFVSHGRYGNGEQDSLLSEHLSPLHIKELNSFAADRLKIEGETYRSWKCSDVAVQLALSELESGEEMDEEAILEEMDRCFDLHNDDYGNDDYGDEYYNSQLYQSVSNQVMKAAEAIIYKKSGPGSVRELLLFTKGNSWAFMPLNYVLAKLVSGNPDGTNLAQLWGREYSVVYDEERNIVFDNFWYFLGIQASESLEKSRGDVVL